MTIDPASKKLLLFGLIGLVIASTLIIGIELRPSTIPPVNGTFVVEITNSLFACESDCQVTSLNVTVDSIMVHREGALNLTGEWIEILHGTKTFDLVQLTKIEEILGSASIPEGAITMIRMNVTSAVANVPFMAGPGRVVILTLPSHELKLPVRPLAQVRAGLTTTATIDFQPHVVCQGKDGCKLTPVGLRVNIKGPG